MGRDAGYDLAAMKMAVLKCDENIRTFQAAIAKECETKAWYEKIVKDLEEKAAAPPRKIVIDAKAQEIFRKL